MSPANFFMISKASTTAGFLVSLLCGVMSAASHAAGLVVSLTIEFNPAKYIKISSASDIWITPLPSTSPRIRVITGVVVSAGVVLGGAVVVTESVVVAAVVVIPLTEVEVTEEAVVSVGVPPVSSVVVVTPVPGVVVTVVTVVVVKTPIESDDGEVTVVASVLPLSEVVAALLDSLEEVVESEPLAVVVGSELLLEASVVVSGGVSEVAVVVVNPGSAVVVVSPGEVVAGVVVVTGVVATVTVVALSDVLITVVVVTGVVVTGGTSLHWAKMVAFALKTVSSVTVSPSSTSQPSKKNPARVGVGSEASR